MPKFQNVNRNAVTGLDLKRLIDAYNLWDVPLMSGTDVEFDVTEGMLLIINADKEEGLPSVFVYPKSEEIPMTDGVETRFVIDWKEGSDEEIQG